MHLEVNPLAPASQCESTAIVFDVRRRRVLYTTEDSERPLPESAGRLRRWSGALRLQSNSFIFCPLPRTFFSLFVLPRQVFTPPGVTVKCHLHGIEAIDGVVSMEVEVGYVVPFEEIDRYLAAVGPQPPTEMIALIAAQVFRVNSASVSVGILLSRSRRDSKLMYSFRQHLETKLRSEAAIQMCSLSVVKVELLNCD